jgi:tetratricopeptide (TPR) repeat protein
MSSHPAETQHPIASAMPPGAAREALRLAVRILDLAETRKRPPEMAQALAQVGRCYKALQAWSPAQSYLEQAARWAHVVGAMDMAVEMACDLAEVACGAAEAHDDAVGHAPHVLYETARDQAFEAARLAGQSADPHWEVKVLLRVSDVLDRCGDHDDAISLQTRALTLISHDASQLGPLDPLEPTRSPAPAMLM